MYSVVIHGGAGVIPQSDTDAPRYQHALQQILKQTNKELLWN
jgi:isoaspartyl peptidase/L-asparaginase-like protein (Ntn-hydrolase superfamily)